MAAWRGSTGEASESAERAPGEYGGSMITQEGSTEGAGGAVQREPDLAAPCSVWAAHIIQIILYQSSLAGA